MPCGEGRSAYTKMSPVQTETQAIELGIMALGALSIANVLASDALILLARYVKSEASKDQFLMTARVELTTKDEGARYHFGTTDPFPIDKYLTNIGFSMEVTTNARIHFSST